MQPFSPGYVRGKSKQNGILLRIKVFFVVVGHPLSTNQSAIKLIGQVTHIAQTNNVQN